MTEAAWRIAYMLASLISTLRLYARHYHGRRPCIAYKRSALYLESDGSMSVLGLLSISFKLINTLT